MVNVTLGPMKTSSPTRKPSQSWTPLLTVTRSPFVPQFTILLDNKVYRGRPGYFVVTPLRLSGSSVHVLVNRGWIAAGARRADLPSVPTPAEEIEIEGLGQEHAPRNRHTHGLIVGGLGLFFVGFLNGSLTSGTGLFCTLWLVRWFGLDYRRAVAYTLVLVGMFWNGAGAVTLALLGEVKWSWLPALLLGSLIGGYLGAHWAIVKGNLWIKRAFEIVTLLVGLKLVT